jgi:hypothetical protein
MESFLQRAQHGLSSWSTLAPDEVRRPKEPSKGPPRPRNDGSDLPRRAKPSKAARLSEPSYDRVLEYEEKVKEESLDREFAEFNECETYEEKREEEFEEDECEGSADAVPDSTGYERSDTERSDTDDEKDLAALQELSSMDGDLLSTNDVATFQDRVSEDPAMEGDALLRSMLLQGLMPSGKAEQDPECEEEPACEEESPCEGDYALPMGWEENMTKALQTATANFRPSAPAQDSAPQQHSNKRRIDMYERLVLKSEEHCARACGLKWNERGPPGPNSGDKVPNDTNDTSKWRGQAWRINTGRWGNRGGKHADYHSDIARYQKANGCDYHTAKRTIDEKWGGDPRKKDPTKMMADALQHAAATNRYSPMGAGSSTDWT